MSNPQDPNPKLIDLPPELADIVAQMLAGSIPLGTQLHRKTQQMLEADPEAIRKALGTPEALELQKKLAEVAAGSQYLDLLKVITVALFFGPHVQMTVEQGRAQNEALNRGIEHFRHLATETSVSEMLAHIGGMLIPLILTVAGVPDSGGDAKVNAESFGGGQSYSA